MHLEIRLLMTKRAAFKTPRTIKARSSCNQHPLHGVCFYHGRNDDKTGCASFNSIPFYLFRRGNVGLFIHEHQPNLVLSGPAAEDDDGNAFQLAETIPLRTVHRIADGALYFVWTLPQG